MKIIDIDSNSNKMKINAIQCYETWKDAMNKWRPYKGSMMWRNISGIDYLIHQTAKIQKSMGARSEETESIYRNFQEIKSELTERIKALKSNQEKHARMCKAVNPNRVPRMLADISRLPVLSNKQQPVSGLASVRETEHMINEQTLKNFKRGAYLINTARGKLCDRDAIANALESGQLAGYAGDVWFPQPAHPMTILGEPCQITV